MSDGISGFGTTLSGASTGTIGEVLKIGVGGMDAGSIDVTTMDSPNKWKEFIANLKDAGEITIDALYEAEQYAVVLGALGGANEVWTITLPDGSTFSCSGYIKSLGLDSPMEDKISQPISIKLSGEPTFDANSGS